MPIHDLYLLLLILCCGYAFIGGGSPERWGAGIMLLGTALTMMARHIGPADYRSIDWGVFSVDLIAMFAFAGLAVLSTRFWPMWLAAMQLDSVLNHLAMASSETVMPWAYAVASKLWAYPMLIMVAWATARHRKRVTLHGSDPSWQRSLKDASARTMRPIG